jgi:hypothetical protein
MVTVNDTDPAIVARAPGQDGTGSLTMMFRVNGAPLYARGGNKIPMELLDGRMSAVAHRRLVQSAAEGNFNMLRIWGGAIFEPRAFYDAADEFGVLMYHDMVRTKAIPLRLGSPFSACRAYRGAWVPCPLQQFAGGTSLTTPQVKSELEYQVKRLSHHPSIAMWDGCNECGGGGDYMNFVMPVVASVDSSRPIWPVHHYTKAIPCSLGSPFQPVEQLTGCVYTELPCARVGVWGGSPEREAQWPETLDRPRGSKPVHRRGAPQWLPLSQRGTRTLYGLYE